MEAFDVRGLAVAAEDFLEELSNWYLRQSRRRFWKTEDDADKSAAYHTLWTCIETYVRLVAPLAPFMTESVYQHVVRPYQDEASATASVHHQRWPQGESEALLREGLARDPVRVMQMLRKDIGLNVDDRIAVRYESGDEELLAALGDFSDYASAELLALRFERGEPGEGAHELKVGARQMRVRVHVERA
jgi:isoleucyl-tRNA synthetase